MNSKFQQCFQQILITAEQFKEMDSTDKDKEKGSIRIYQDLADNILGSEAQEKETELPEVNKTYESLMLNAGLPDFQLMRLRLKEEGVEILKDFQEEFRLTCIKTDWESTIYQIKYGRFLMDLKIFSINLKAAALFGPAFCAGNFGEILLLQLTNNSTFALKNIKVRSGLQSSINLALRQVFVAKIASALRAGPKFEELLSYDAILYEDCLQFAMEACETGSGHPGIRKQKESKSLLKLLKIFHHFHICHLDIKNDNIAWSPAFNKVVFLDFGLSEIIKEEVGYKKKIGFKGSFKYCSPEMKRLFILKEDKKIDLYYNDLHCLKISWKNIKENAQHDQQELSSSSQSEDCATTKDCSIAKKKNVAFRYFSLKFNIFMGKFDEVLLLIKQETDLIQTYQAIVEHYLLRNKSDHILSQKLQKSCLQLIQKFRKLAREKKTRHSIDILLLQIESHQQDRFPSLLYRQIVEASGSDTEFAQIWDVPLWKEQIFFFVDVHSNAGENREKLVDKIYRNIANVNLPLRQSYTMKFREVLVYYRDYFGVKKNVANLERILTYFVLLRDDYNRDRTEEIILNYWENQGKYIEYFRYNFKYFLGKIAITEEQQVRFQTQNIRNAQRVLKNVKQTSTDTNLVDWGSKSIKNMKLVIKNFKKMAIRKKAHKKYMQELQIQDEKVWKFLQMIFHKGLEQDSTEISYEDFYLEKCAFQFKINKKLKIFMPKSQVKQYLSKQSFYKQLLAYENLCFFSSKNQTERTLRRSYCNDLKQLLQLDPSLNHPKFFQILIQNCTLNEIHEFPQILLNNPDLFDLKQGSQIFVLRNLIMFIIRATLIFKFGFMSQLDKQGLGRLFDIVMGYLGRFGGQEEEKQENGSSEIIKENELSQSEEETDMIFKMRYSQNHKLMRLLAFVLIAKESEVSQELFSFLQNNQHFDKVSYFFRCILCLSVRNVTNLQNERFFAILKQMQDLSKYSYVSVLMHFPQFFDLALQAYRTKNNFNQALSCLFETLWVLHPSESPIIFTKIFQIAIKFVQAGSRTELERIIEVCMPIGLEQFSKSPQKSYVFYVAHANVKTRNIELYTQVKRRLFMVCIMNAHHFAGLHFETYKVHLYHQTYLLGQNPYKSAKIRHRRKLASLSEFREGESPTFKPKFKQIQQKSERRQLTESSITTKIKLYLKKSLK